MSEMTKTVTGNVQILLILLGILCPIGGIGNLLIVVVYSLKRERFTSTVFIVVLALTDTFVCLVLIPMTMIIEGREWRISSSLLCKGYYVLNNTVVFYSSLLITAIAFDRYFCLCHPFQRIMTVERAKLINLVLIIFCLCISIPSAFCIKIIKSSALETSEEFSEDQEEQTDKILYECAEIKWANATKLELYIFRTIAISQNGCYGLCVISVTILYLLIYRSLSKVYQKRDELRGRTLHGNILKHSVTVEAGQNKSLSLIANIHNIFRMSSNISKLNNRKKEVTKCSIFGQNRSNYTAEPSSIGCGQNSSRESYLITKKAVDNYEMEAKTAKESDNNLSIAKSICHMQIPECTMQNASRNIDHLEETKVKFVKNFLLQDLSISLVSQESPKFECQPLSSDRQFYSQGEVKPISSPEVIEVRCSSDDHASLSHSSLNTCLHFNTGDVFLRRDEIANTIESAPTKEDLTADLIDKFEESSQSGGGLEPELWNSLDAIVGPSNENKKALVKPNVSATVSFAEIVDKTLAITSEEPNQGEILISDNLTYEQRHSGDKEFYQSNQGLMHGAISRVPIQPLIKSDRNQTSKDYCSEKLDCKASDNNAIKASVEPYETGQASSSWSHRRSIKSFKETPDFHNMKTAAMLFAVTVVYILTLLPAITMALGLVRVHLVIFYMYYLNNVVNPIIYGFMNPRFRADVKQQVMCRRPPS